MRNLVELIQRYNVNGLRNFKQRFFFVFQEEITHLITTVVDLQKRHKEVRLSLSSLNVHGEILLTDLCAFP